jgi:hypothetical protein
MTNASYGVVKMLHEALHKRWSLCLRIPARLRLRMTGEVITMA